MPLFFSEIRKLSDAVENTAAGLLLPDLLRQNLRRFNASTPNSRLQHNIVRAFLSIKRDSQYYAIFARKIPCLSRFKTEIGAAIERRTLFHVSQTLTEDLLFSTTLSQEEIRICAEYYLMKSKIWTPQNQNRIDNHQSLYAIIKIMNLLHHRGLLTQENFDFISQSSVQARDTALLIAALERKNWLDTAHLNDIRSLYKPKLGKVALLVSSSKVSQHNKTFYLTERARHILECEAQENHSIFMSSGLHYFSRKNISIQIPKDLQYFQYAESVSHESQQVITSIKNSSITSSIFFEKNSLQNNLSPEDFAHILSLSAFQIEKLANELHLLQERLGRFVFDQRFFDVLITAIKQNDFISRKLALTLLDEKNCLDTHIIFMLYQIKNYHADSLLASIDWLLARSAFSDKQPLIRFYLEHNAPALSEIISNTASMPLHSNIYVIIYSKSKNVIDRLQAKNAWILTPKFLYHLQWESLILIMEWALEQEDKLPWKSLIDTDFINLSKLKHVSEIIKILNHINKPITPHFFSFITHPKKLSRLFKEIASILPILMNANLINELDMTTLITYLAQNFTSSCPSPLISSIRELPSGALNKTLLNQLMHDQKFAVVTQKPERVSHEHVTFNL